MSGFDQKSVVMLICNVSATQVVMSYRPLITFCGHGPVTHAIGRLGKERVESSRVCHDAMSAQEATLDICVENSLN
jgi:hypothetical protein